MFYIEPQNGKKAIKIIPHCSDEKLFRVGLQTKCAVAFTFDGQIDTWVPDSHRYARVILLWSLYITSFRCKVLSLRSVFNVYDVYLAEPGYNVITYLQTK